MGGSADTFKMDTVKEVMVTGCATISFSGQRTDTEMALSSVDVFSV